MPFLTQLPLLHLLQLISVISIALCKVKTLGNIVNISIYMSTLSKEDYVLARFFDENLVMNYANDQIWYDIHPLLMDSPVMKRAITAQTS